MAPFTSYLSTIRRPTANTLINLAPRPIRPLARDSMSWLKKAINPLAGLEEEEEEEEDELQPREDEISRENDRDEWLRSRTPDQETSMETMFVPVIRMTPERKIRREVLDAGSRCSTPELLVSEFLDEVVMIHVPCEERERVARELKEAMDEDYFDAWLVNKEEEDQDGTSMEETRVFKLLQTPSEIMTREEIFRKWGARKEKGLEECAPRAYDDESEDEGTESETGRNYEDAVAYFDGEILPSDLSSRDSPNMRQKGNVRLADA